jgi:hypothetical protein
MANSTIQTILINLRAAVVRFADPYTVPANIPNELGKLLPQLGINNPGGPVKAQLDEAVKSWGQISNTLSGLNLNFVDPVQTLQDLTKKADTVQKNLNDILHKPDQIWTSLGASGQAIKEVFPKRLLDYIIYEFLIASHKKIAGAFLLFGVLRKEFVAAAGPAFVNAEIRVFDLAQLLEVITNPREAILKALKWGTDDFNARPVVDGLVLLGALAPNTVAGPDDQIFDRATENLYVKRGNELNALLESALHSLTVNAGTQTTLEFVGLHRTGVGVLVDSPFVLSGNLNVLNVPQGLILALTPGADRLTSPPKVEVLTP